MMNSAIARFLPTLRDTGVATGAGCAINALRERGIVTLATLNWLALAAVVAVGITVGASTLPVLVMGMAANIAPTLMAVRRRHDVEARLIAATPAAAMPALLTYVLQGHAWQMDSHMYFFVALAALTVLCDWRPILLASGLIAVHHLLLEWLAPTWVFAGEGNIGRVLIHAVAVVLQFLVLSHVTTRLAGLLRAQDEAVVTSARLAAEAEGERKRAEDALAAAKAAEAHAERVRAEKRGMEQRHAEARRAELLALATDFERSVAGIAVAIEVATGQLELSAAQLDDLSGAAGREASDVAANACEATWEIRRVAEAISTLGMSIGSIAAAAEQQRCLTAIGHEKGERSAATIAELDTRTEQIGGFIDAIRGIAAKTNLLALNATIEASRAGEAGRGFAVVATEVKGLAAETAQASDRIIELLSDVRSTVDASVSDAGTVNQAVAEVSQAATGIAAEAAEQRTLASNIEDSATRATGNADLIEQRIGHLADSVGRAVALSATVRTNISALTVNARDLRGSVEGFVRHLRDEAPAPKPVRAA